MVDLPKDSYKSKVQAYNNASYFISNNLADLVKVETDMENIDIVQHLIKKGIPICAHIGLLPQSIKNKSGYRKYGKTKKEAQYYYNLAMKLNAINVNIILIECLDNSIAKRICKDTNIPVIGIGSGQGIDGQVAVIYDLLGISFNKIDAFSTDDRTPLDKQIFKFKKKIKIMQVINDQKSLENILIDFKNKNKKISLIPTMGNLHNGHLELFDNAPSDTIKVVTIYINPLQFNDEEDYKNYPRSVKSDIEKCDKKNIDIVYSPHGCITDEIAFEENIDLPKFTRYLCGSTQDNHFLGVYKIVKHLFSIIQPDFACFGKKDYQQLLLIKYIAKYLFPKSKNY